LNIVAIIRRHWPEALLVLAIALPWLSLIVLGSVWLWQGGYTWAWAIAAAALAASAWLLTRIVRQRANVQARLELGEQSEPAAAWNAGEREAWADVLAVANATAPLSFTEVDPLVATAWRTVEAVARRLHPDAHSAWAQFTLPEILLLTERVARDLRQTVVQFIPGVRDVRLSHVLWLKSQADRYGPLVGKAWRLWRLVRLPLNPAAAAGQEISRVFSNRSLEVVARPLRVRLTQEFVLAVGRAAIDLYSGRLALSDDDIRAAHAVDAAVAAEPLAPVRIVLVGQINAGKSSLINALAQETRCAVGPVPTTSRITEHRLELDGRPAVLLVDMPGLGDAAAPELLTQVERADFVVWVASATQPAREPDRQGLDEFRAWAQGQLVRRPPPLVVALTHIDALRPAGEWEPPYDVAMPARAKARSIRAAIDAVASTLDVSAHAIVPVAMPPGREPYNLDALWARIAVEIDEAKLAQLDRLRVGRGLNLRELAGQLGRSGRLIVESIVRANS
jgi:uncharacterized protein